MISNLTNKETSLSKVFFLKKAYEQGNWLWVISRNQDRNFFAELNTTNEVAREEKYYCTYTHIPLMYIRSTCGIIKQRANKKSISYISKSDFLLAGIFFRGGGKMEK